jgi:hypothetical protein
MSVVFQAYYLLLAQKRRKVGENHTSSFDKDLSSMHRLVYQII